MGKRRLVDEPFTSVVTPVHNTEAYLAECIESVIGQSYENFEYLIVDNASTDRSGEIAAEYAARDKRIRVIKTGRLLSQLQNFNFTLEQASPQAKYVKMVQADDWVFPNCVEEMVALAEAHTNVGIVSSYRMREAAVHGVGLHPTRNVVSGREICRMHLVDRVFMFGSPTTVMYRGELVRTRQPFFNEGRLHADTEAAYEILQDRDFGFVHQILSFSRMQENSISGGVRGFAPDELDRLITVKRYAGLYLSEDERQQVTTSALAEYYDALARSALVSADPKFWEYHRAGLETIGETIETPRVALHMFRVVGHLALSPLNLMRRFRHRKPNDSEVKSATDWVWGR